MHLYSKDDTLHMFCLKFQNKKVTIHVFCLSPKQSWLHLKDILHYDIYDVMSVNTLCQWILLKVVTKSFIWVKIVFKSLNNCHCPRRSHITFSSVNLGHLLSTVVLYSMWLTLDNQNLICLETKCGKLQYLLMVIQGPTSVCVWICLQQQ